MTYDANEISVESGSPVELYVFQLGTQVFRYTSAEEEFTYSGSVYYPRAIERSAPVQADSERRNDLKIALPADDPVATPFIGIVPGQPMYLDVLRVHRGDTQAYNIWAGRIIGATFTGRGAVCELNGMTSESAFNRTIPRFKYQGLCNHVLYDSSCGISKSSYVFSGNIDAVDGSTVTINGLTAATSADWAVGGYINHNDADFRLITAQATDVLTISLPFSSDVLTQAVDVQAGCIHTLAVCASKFSNNLNYGGFAFVPTLNPFGTSLT